MRWICILLSVLLPSPPAHAGEPRTDIKPARVTFKAESATAKDFFEAIKKQTAMSVFDGRNGTAKTPHAWDLRDVTFWQALENGRSQIGYRLAPARHFGEVAALAGGESIPSAEDGIFHLAVQRLSLTRDFEDGSHLCHLNLQLMWEPRFQPFHVDVGSISATYLGGSAKPISVSMAGQGKQEVTGAHATTLAVRFPAPPGRAYDRLENLKASLTVVMPTRMLSFPFDKLAILGKAEGPRTAIQDGVTVSVKQVSAGPDRWSFTLQIDNAPGVPSFESYQSWLGNNRIVLEKDAGKTTWEPLADDMEILEETAKRAVIRYHFTESKYLSTTKLADWTLRYTTPHRIVAVPATFQVPRIDLP